MESRLRLYSGLVLLAFVTCHLLNLALGVWSLSALEVGLLVFMVIWLIPWGTAVLLAAGLIHTSLALWGLIKRRSWRMPSAEALRVALGLAILPLLFSHIINTRFVAQTYDIWTSYPYQLYIYFVAAPREGMQQVAALLVVWLHACLGVHLWLRFKPWYPSVLPWFRTIALLLPTFSLFGFWISGREVQRLGPAAWHELPEALEAALGADVLAFRGYWERTAYTAYLVLLVAAVVARLARKWWQTRADVITVAYPSGQRTKVPLGASILDASRKGGIPHASLCDGRGRCSTCRVRIARGIERLDPPSNQERLVLERIVAPPNIRLACQARPQDDIEVIPLLPPDIAAKDARVGKSLKSQEREVVVLFADLREFSKLTEKSLPYDVVFLLNRYFAVMGEAVEHAGGHIDKFIGDGIMALFGVHASLDRACRQACEAARAMAGRLADINQSLSEELPKPLRIGIGIHAGRVIIGEMGYGDAVSLTAIGDTVNTAKRLEQATKSLNVQAVISAPVARRAGYDFSAHPFQEISIRGHRDRLTVVAVPDLGTIS
jgi:adenylate cyclase